MASPGFCLEISDEDENVNGPLEQVEETGESICGWCGQLLIPNHNNQTPQEHFESCNKDNGLLKVFKDQRRVQQSLKLLSEKMDTMKAEVMEEIKADHIRMKTEFKNDILDFKAKIKTELETMRKVVGEDNDGALVAFNNQLNVLKDGMEKKMREMGAAHEKQMAEVNGRLTGVTETTTTFVNSILEEMRGKSSADRNEQVPPKRDVETILEREKNNDGDVQTIKRQVENEDESSSAKKLRFHLEPSRSEQLTIPMNSFDLVAHNDLFQPSYTWIIEDIEKKMEQETLDLSSDLFQWNGYPFHARAKLQLKKGNNRVHTSLRLKDVSKVKSQPKEMTVIPQVFFVLKDSFSKQNRFARHKCTGIRHLSGPLQTSQLFEVPFADKFWFNLSPYKVSDWVEMEIHVESPQMTQQVHSKDGTLVWNIDNYARRLQLEKDYLVLYQESPYFLVSDRGYRVQMEVFLNGDAGRQGLIARILFLTGNYDGRLQMPIPHSTTVTLLNRKEPERSVAKTVEKNIINAKRFYDIEICKLEEVKNFVENDTLFFKVSIESQKKASKASLK